jgi:Uma2 family endonuclease
MNATAAKPHAAPRLSPGELRSRWLELRDDPLVAAILPGAFPRAPELRVEIVSPWNSNIEMREKTAAYLKAGAREVWLVAEDATIEMFDARGRIEASSFGIALTPPR